MLTTILIPGEMRHVPRTLPGSARHDFVCEEDGQGDNGLQHFKRKHPRTEHAQKVNRYTSKSKP